MKKHVHNGLMLLAFLSVLMLEIKKNGLYRKACKKKNLEKSNKEKIRITITEGGD